MVMIKTRVKGGGRGLDNVPPGQYAFSLPGLLFNCLFLVPYKCFFSNKKKIIHSSKLDFAASDSDHNTHWESLMMKIIQNKSKENNCRGKILQFSSISPILPVFMLRTILMCRIRMEHFTHTPKDPNALKGFWFWMIFVFCQMIIKLGSGVGGGL